MLNARQCVAILAVYAFVISFHGSNNVAEAFQSSSDDLTRPNPAPSPSPTPTPASAVWTVELFNVDDEMRVLCNGEQVGPTVGFGQSQTIALNPCLRAGRNDLVIISVNAGGGWTWGYRVRVDSQIAITRTGQDPADHQCGTAGSVACSDDTRAGEVFRKAYILYRGE